MIPTRLTGKEFERILVARHDEYRKYGHASVGRYGVQAVHTGDNQIVAIKSLPDFEGVSEWFGNRHIIFDAKVCSQASFNLSKYRELPGKSGDRRRQLTHMLERADFGSICFFLIHWNERELKKETIPAQTWMVPVSTSIEFWNRFERGEVKSLKLADCEEFGFEVVWKSFASGRTLRPDWLRKLRDAWSDWGNV